MNRTAHRMGGRFLTPGARLRGFSRADRHFRDLDLGAESVAEAIAKRNREIDDIPRAFRRVTFVCRAQAILICAIAASADIVPTTVDGIVRVADLDPDAGDLADAAWIEAAESIVPEPAPGQGENSYIARRRLDHNRREPWALAECLLREGWTP